MFAGLSNPPLAPHNNQYNREANCIEQADESAALPIFVFMVAQVKNRQNIYIFREILTYENTYVTYPYFLHFNITLAVAWMWWLSSIHFGNHLH